jgi:adenylosuccinate lyase
MRRLIKKAIHGFIATLDVTEEVRAELMQITPSNFVGI